MKLMFSGLMAFLLAGAIAFTLIAILYWAAVFGFFDSVSFEIKPVTMGFDMPQKGFEPVAIPEGCSQALELTSPDFRVDRVDLIEEIEKIPGYCDGGGSTDPFHHVFYVSGDYKKFIELATPMIKSWGRKNRG